MYPPQYAPGILPINFEFNSNTIRVTEIDGAPWFIASDVCKALGLTHVTMALQNCNNSEVQNYRIPGTRGRSKKIVSESGLYELIFQSRKPEGVAEDILGHQKKTMSYDVYSGGSSMAQKREAVLKLDYGFANLGAKVQT